MGEARRRKLAGMYPQRTQRLGRSDAIAWAMNFLATTEDETVTGITLIPADDGAAVYLPADVGRRVCSRSSKLWDMKRAGSCPQPPVTKERWPRRWPVVENRGRERMPGQGRRFQPGQSGNPGGRPRALADVIDLARQHTTDAIRALCEVATQADAHPSARVAA